MREGGDQVELRDGVYFELKHGSLDILIFICNLSERDKGQCLLITPIFKRLRQKDFKFKASLGCKKSSRQPWNTLVRPCLNKKSENRVYYNFRQYSQCFVCLCWCGFVLEMFSFSIRSIF